MTEKRGRGQPPMRPEDKKKRISTRLSPEWIAFLDEMVALGYTKAAVINKGLYLVRKYIAKGGVV